MGALNLTPLPLARSESISPTFLQPGRWSQREEAFLVKMCNSQKCWSWVVSPFPSVSKYHSLM